MPEVTIDLRNLRDVTNDRFYGLFSDAHRYLVLFGGAGSGKSVFAADKLVVRCMMEAEHEFLALRKVGTTLLGSVFSEVGNSIRRLGVERIWRANHTTLSWWCIPNHSGISCIGMDNVDKLKSRHRITGVWIEEATELSEYDLEQLILRARTPTPHYRQFILTFNPVSIFHWLRRRFFVMPDEDVRVVHSTYRDNRFLDRDYIAELDKLRERNPGMWRVYGEGDWGVSEHLVFERGWMADPWPDLYGRLDADGNVIPGTSRVQEMFYGLDFGFNAPTALMQHDICDGEIYVTELIYEKRLTNADLIRRMDEMGISTVAPIYCDNAEPDRIAELQAAGYNAVPADKGPGSLKAGLDFLKSLRIHTGEWNANLNWELATYSYRDQTGGLWEDVPMPENDHAIDAVRYAVWTHLRTRSDLEYFVDVDLRDHGLLNPIADLRGMR